MAKNPPENIKGMARLLGIGEGARREFRLGGKKASIGSAPDNDFVVSDPTVSHRHASIYRRRNSYLVSDLGSTNGTFVNGRAAKRPTTLNRGDELRLGAVRMVFVTDLAAPSYASGRLGSKWIRMTGAIVTTLALFSLGFALVQYVFNWSKLEELPPSRSRSIAGEHSAKMSAGSPPKKAPSSKANVSEAKPASSAVAAPASSEAPAGKEPAWIKRINYYRAMAGLEPVVEDPELDRGDRLHAHYLVKTYAADIRKGKFDGAALHSENPSSPWYTPEGLKAAQSSDLSAWPAKGGDGGATGVIDDLMSIAFHRLWILDPSLKKVGYGEYCEAGACAAALNVLNASDMPALRPVALKEPVRFPAPGSTVGLRASEAEWPDPLSSCPGYSAPAGLAVTLQLGTMITAKLGSYRLTRQGQEIESCGFDAQSYRNPDPSAQERARKVLHDLGTVVVIPKKPLKPGRYEASLVVGGQPYNWSFTVQ